MTQSLRSTNCGLRHQGDLNKSDKKITFLEWQFKGWDLSLYHSIREQVKGTLLSHTVHTLHSKDLKSMISLTYFPSLGHVQTKQRDRLEAHIKEFGCVNTITTNDAVRLPPGTKEKERFGPDVKVRKMYFDKAARRARGWKIFRFQVLCTPEAFRIQQSGTIVRPLVAHTEGESTASLAVMHSLPRRQQ